MTTIQQINEWRARHGQSRFLNREEATAKAAAIREQTGHYEPVKDCTPAIHYLEDAIRSFERSPKSKGNREHFYMLLTTHLDPHQANEIAYGQYF